MRPRAPAAGPGRLPLWPGSRGSHAGGSPSLSRPGPARLHRHAGPAGRGGSLSRPGAASPPQSAGTCKSGRFGRGGTQASSRCGGAGIPGQSRACLASSGPGGPAWLWQVSEGGSGPRWTRGSPAPAVRLLAPPPREPAGSGPAAVPPGRFC